MINLPTCPPVRSASMRLVSFAVDQVPSQGGPQSRVLRLGDRFAGEFVTYPAAYAEEGRVYLSRLMRGMTETVAIGVPEPGMRGGDYGTPQIATAGAFGSSVTIKGLGAGRVIPEGKFFSIITGGQRFLYQATATITADGSGQAVVPIYPMLRRQPQVNDVVELSAPKMEGFVQGNQMQWEVTKSKRIGFVFQVMERE